MKIRTRAILVIISTNFVIILLSILAGTGNVRENIEKYIETDMMVVADIADRFISSELDLLRYEAGSTAEHISQAEPGDWPGILAAELRLYPKFNGMAIISRNAEIAAVAGTRPATAAALENEYVQKAFSSETAFSSTVKVSESDAPLFYLAAPIPGAAGHILVLTLDGMYFSDLASEYHVWETGHIFIDDNEGYIIANIRPEWVLNRQNFILSAKDEPQYEAVATVITKLISGDRSIAYYSMDGIPRICAYRPISGSPEGWCLGIVAPLSESPVRDIDRGLLLVAIVGFLLNIVAAVIASNFIRKPFEEVAALQKMTQTALAEAEHANNAKSSFLAHMSHEIRTPLNAVIGFSELTLDEVNLAPEAKANIEKISGAGSTILSIVNDILDISKIESGKLELYPIQYDTPSLINDTVILNIVRIGEKNISFKLDVDQNLPGRLYGDDLRVKQIFNNLLSNAFKYTNSGTVEWRISFTRDREKNDTIWIVSSIKDSGIGIKPEDIKKLFADYNQVDAKTNRKVEGTGLGLAITKQLVEMMDGEITVQSEYGKGTTFSVRLRQTLTGNAVIGEEVAQNLMSMRYSLSRRDRRTKQGRVDLSYAHILLVDDVVTNLDVAKGMMKPYKLKIDCAESGPEAIEMIQSESPRYNALFLDHMMPGMDGIETAKQIRELGTEYARNIPIIALTANAIVGNNEMLLKSGFQDFISKPIDMIKLDAILRTWVRDKKREQEQAIIMEEELTEAQSMAKHGVGASFEGITIEGMDKNKALLSFNGDGEILFAVLKSYTECTRPLLENLKEYLDAENLGDYAITVHGIKGASYGIAAERTGDAARELEFAAKAGYLETVKAGHKKLVKSAEILLSAIEAALAKINMTEPETPH